MKSNAYIILGVGIILLLGYTYAENETVCGDAVSVISVNEPTEDVVTTTTTTSTGTTTTSVKATTTTTTTTLPAITIKSSKPVNTAKPKTTTTVKKKTCNSYCKNIGYDGGDCRLNGLECRVRGEVKSVYGGRLCPTARLDTCCCQTDDSVEKESKYSYTLVEPIQPLLDRSTPTTKSSRAIVENESLETLKAYLDNEGEYELVEE